MGVLPILFVNINFRIFVRQFFGSFVLRESTGPAMRRPPFGSGVAAGPSLRLKKFLGTREAKRMSHKQFLFTLQNSFKVSSVVAWIV